MKRRMCVKEFGDYCARNKPKQILFNSKDQPWRTPLDTCVFCFTFDTITVCEDPDGIYLCSRGADTYLDGVKFVEIDEDESPIGTTLRVFCNGKVHGQNMPYILVLS